MKEGELQVVSPSPNHVLVSALTASANAVADTSDLVLQPSWFNAVTSKQAEPMVNNAWGNSNAGCKQFTPQGAGT